MLNYVNYDATWTLMVRASFSRDENSTYRNRLASLLKQQGFKEAKTTSGLMTWKREDTKPDSAINIVQKIFEAHNAPRKVVHIRELTIKAMPKYRRFS